MAVGAEAVEDVEIIVEGTEATKDAEIIIESAEAAEEVEIAVESAEAAEEVEIAVESAESAEEAEIILKEEAASETFPLENGPYIKDGKPNGRPGPTGKAKLKFEQEVYNRQVGKDGVLREPYPPYREINWKPGEPRKGVVDFGHVEGKSYKKQFQKYKNGEITLDELKEFQSNPENFRIEIPSSNRSHVHE